MIANNSVETRAQSWGDGIAPLGDRLLLAMVRVYQTIPAPYCQQVIIYSGLWNYAEKPLNALFLPGFYIFDRPIAIPKIIAVPLTIAICVFASNLIFSKLEKWYRHYRNQIGQPISPQQAQHHMFSMATFVAFNVYFLFGGRPILKAFHPFVEPIFSALVVLVSTLWLYRTLVPLRGIQNSKFKIQNAFGVRL